MSNPHFHAGTLRRVFATDSNWATRTPRLTKSDLLPSDPKPIARVLAMENQPPAGVGGLRRKDFDWGILSLDFWRQVC